MSANFTLTLPPARPINGVHLSSASILLNTIVTLILLNNLVYQTKFQLFQPIFVLIVFFLLLLYVALNSGRVRIWFYILMFVLVVYLVGCIVFNQFEILYSNRALFNFSAAASYLIIFFFLSKKEMPVFYLNAFTVIFLLGGIYIFTTGDRDLFNPNFYAMTMFYLIAMSRHRQSIWLVLTLAILSILLYGSRGAFLSFSVAFILMASKGLLSPWRNTIAVFFVAGTVAMFYFVEFLYLNQNNLFFIISDLAAGGRGLGGREGALVEGYSKLVDSNYLGNGIGASTSFNVLDSIGVEKDVHVHFGLLDISLKFGLFGVVFVYLFAGRLIRLAHRTYLPFIVGGLMTVFYYNGLATSHLGLNFLLYFFLGQAFYSVRRQYPRFDLCYKLYRK